MKLADVGELPTTLNGHQAADLLGCSYGKLLELVRRGEAPVEPLRFGRSLRWSTVAVLAAIGIVPEREGAGPWPAGVLVPLDDQPRDERDHRAG